MKTVSLVMSYVLCRTESLLKMRFGIPMSIFAVILFSGLVMSLTGCALLKKPPTQIETVAARAILPSYAGPKARITVADFEIKAAKARGEMGSGLREMLTTALINSNRFLVVGRQGADLIITTAVTEFEPQASGGRAGVGGGGGVGSGILGGLLGAALNKTRMVLDIRIVDTSTSKVLSITRVRAQASDIAEAKRTCIIEAVSYLSEAIPTRYYKY